MLMGLVVFGADPLSSTAYATEEMFLALQHGGFGPEHFWIAIPIAFVISTFIFVITFSYRQIVHAFPSGGGVYSVARAHLGETPSLVGAASLITDYILTVAVSIAAGVSAVISAFPQLAPWRTDICIGLIIFLAWLSLRGARENAKVLSVPICLFIGTFAVMIAYGIVSYLMGTITHETRIAVNGGLISSIGIFGIGQLIKTFASGCTAMTGIEAASNGTILMQRPVAENASRVMFWMAAVLSAIFIGITVLACITGVVPSAEKTVVAQIALAIFGFGFMFLLVSAVTTAILVLAANTAFASLPLFLSMLAKDGYFPNQFMNLGSRLVFKNGIIGLAALSCSIEYVFGGNVHAIIPLYAICVFLSFSIAQFAMVIKWFRKEKINVTAIAINGVGFMATATVFFFEVYAKLFHGAWILVPIIISLVCFMKFLSTYYKEVNDELAIGKKDETEPEKTVVVLVSKMSRAAIRAINAAKSLNPEHLLAVHIATDRDEETDVRRLWAKHIPGIDLTTIFSEDRDLITPVLTFLKNLDVK